MIIPAYNHDRLCSLSVRNYIQLVTCKKGTYIELISRTTHKPIKNGRLALIDNEGGLTLFSNPNKIHVAYEDNKQKTGNVIKVIET